MRYYIYVSQEWLSEFDYDLDHVKFVLTGQLTDPDPQPIASVPLSQPLSVQELRPPKVGDASRPIMAKLAGFFKGKILLSFFRRTMPSRAIALATSL